MATCFVFAGRGGRVAGSGQLGPCVQRQVARPGRRFEGKLTCHAASEYITAAPVLRREMCAVLQHLESRFQCLCVRVICLVPVPGVDARVAVYLSLRRP